MGPDRRMQRLRRAIGRHFLKALLAIVVAVVAGVIVFNLTQGDSAPLPEEQFGIATPEVTGFALTCNGLGSQMKPGDRIELVYEIEVEFTSVVGLGAGFYDEAGTDRSTGLNDIDSLIVDPGGPAKRRLFIIPNGIPPGNYELVGEIWPANMIGQGETMKDTPCPEAITIGES